MKTCSYCGQENADSAPTCCECGTELSIAQAGRNGEQAYAPAVLDLRSEPDAFTFADGFTRPDWDWIRQRINTLTREEWHAAWRDAVWLWLCRLQQDLGGEYRVHESAGIFLLGEDSPTSTELLRFCESTADRIAERLGEAAWRGYYGKHVVLCFTDVDDYYQYISYYYGDGTHALSGGVCIQRGYIHIALPRNDAGNRRVIAHELTHNKLAHLRLPRWLDEGLAISFENESVGIRDTPLDPDFLFESQSYWDDAKIQQFWSGEAFYDPTMQKYSYPLARCLVRALAVSREAFVAFIQNASYVDGGQTAAVECLDKDLGEAILPFVSAGQRRPDRRIIAAYLDALKGKSD